MRLTDECEGVLAFQLQTPLKIPVAITDDQSIPRKVHQVASSGLANQVSHTLTSQSTQSSQY